MKDETRSAGDWGQENTQAFLDHGRYFVPDRDAQMAVIGALVPEGPGPISVLELCCGEGLLATALLDRLPGCSVRGLDGSPEMLEHVQRALAPYGERFSAARFDLAATDWRTAERPARAIVSSLAIHHLDDAEKQALYRDLLPLLEPGGALIIADLIRPATPAGVALAAEAWDEDVRRAALSLDGHLRAFEFFTAEGWNHFRTPDPCDRPSRLSDHLRWLEQAGFVDVDVHWLKAGHAIYSGRRPVEV